MNFPTKEELQGRPCPECHTRPGRVILLFTAWQLTRCEPCQTAFDERNTSKKMTPPHEFTTQEIKDGRKTHFKSLTQPFRNGEISREFVEAFPEQVKKMITESSVSMDQVNNAKYVWKDLPGWENRENSK